MFVWMTVRIGNARRGRERGGRIVRLDRLRLRLLFEVLSLNRNADCRPIKMQYNATSAPYHKPHLMQMSQEKTNLELKPLQSFTQRALPTLLHLHSSINNTLRKPNPVLPSKHLRKLVLPQTRPILHFLRRRALLPFGFRGGCGRRCGKTLVKRGENGALVRVVEVGHFQPGVFFCFCPVDFEMS
jgi:hypothetical protein